MAPLKTHLPARELLLASVAASALVSLIHLTPPTLFEGVDWQQLHLPARQYMVASLAEGRLPLWNPYVALGRPFLADIETAVFYPPNLAFLVLEPTLAHALLTVGHATLAIVGMLLLGRHLRLERWAFWLCAILFASSEALVSRVQSGQTHYAEAITYLPLLLLLAARLADAFSWAGVLAVAGTLALQLLCGHPQIAWLTWLALGAFLLGRLELGRLRQAGLGLVALGIALAAALALAAPTLLPFIELAGQGNRAPQAIERSGDQGMGRFYWSSLAVPDGGARSFYWEFDVYTGLCVLIGGVAGLVATWRERETRGLLGMALLGVLLGSGGRTPAFWLFFHLVPGTSLFRLHARAALLVVVALLLGLGLFLSRRLRARTLAIALGAGAFVAALLTLAYYGSAPAGIVTVPPLPRVAWLAAAVTALAGTLVARRAETRALAAFAVVAVALADLGTSIPPAKRAWRMEVRRAGERPLQAFLLQHGLYDPRGTPPRVAVPPELVRENAGQVYGWSHVAGYQAVSLARVWVFLHESLGLAPPTESTFPSDLIYSRGPFPYDSMNLVAGVEPKTGQMAGRIVADPRAYVASSARRIAHWRQAASLIKGGHDFHSVALVEGPGPAGPVEGPSGGDRRSATIRSFAPESLTVETDGDGPGLLVLAEPWYPGWEAAVDGAPGICLPANGWMRAVPVPPGRHLVTLQFRSRWLAAGVALSGVTLLGLGAIVRNERRRKSPFASDRTAS